MPTNGSLAFTLDSLSLSGAGTAVHPGTLATSLHAITVTATGRTGIDQSGALAFNLRSLTVSGVGHKQTGVGALTLQSISVQGAGHSGITQSGMGAATFSPVKVVITAQPPQFGIPNKVLCLTGFISSTGSAIFQFQGPPNTGVEWTILTGSGSITAITPYTDTTGAAYARYDAGGYLGTLKIGVSFVP